MAKLKNFEITCLTRAKETVYVSLVCLFVNSIHHCSIYASNIYASNIEKKWTFLPYLCPSNKIIVNEILQKIVGSTLQISSYKYISNPCYKPKYLGELWYHSPGVNFGIIFLDTVFNSAEFTPMHLVLVNISSKIYLINVILSSSCCHY